MENLIVNGVKSLKLSGDRSVHDGHLVIPRIRARHRTHDRYEDKMNCMSGTINEILNHVRTAVGILVQTESQSMNPFAEISEI